MLRVQDAQQAVLLVVDAGGEPERVVPPVVAVPGQQAPQARLGERLAGGGAADLAGYLVRVASAVLGKDVDPAVTDVAGQERAGRRAYRRGREGGRLQRTARESLSEGPGWATGRGPRAGGRKVAATTTVQLMRASTVIDSIISDSVTNDAEIDSRKPKRPTLRLMMRAPSVEAV